MMESPDGKSCNASIEYPDGTSVQLEYNGHRNSTSLTMTKPNWRPVKGTYANKFFIGPQGVFDRSVDYISWGPTGGATKIEAKGTALFESLFNSNGIAVLNQKGTIVTKASFESFRINILIDTMKECIK